MVVSRRDEAISEVIGFVLILALIAIVASLYLTYVVPAQGRDMEIAHMDVVQDQFLSYKTTVDSLWINNRYNTQISSPFTLGTNPGSTQGSFVNFPLFQPVTSSGTMVVNGRNDVITVTANALYNQGNESEEVTPDIPQIEIEPEHLYVSFKTSNNNLTDYIIIEPIYNVPKSGKGNWKVILNTSPGQQQTPLKISIINGTRSVDNQVIQNSVINNSPYLVDLADSAYGLKEAFEYPFNLNNFPDGGPVTRTPDRYYEKTGAIFNHKMGSLEYRSSNNYWISQNYIYQYGGVFLQQDTGDVVKLLPSITITKDLVNQNLARVTINDITISNRPPSRVGGSSLVEVLTTLKKPDFISNNLVNSQEYGIANAKFVTITVNADDAPSAQMWNSTFEKINQSSGLSTNWGIIINQTGNSVTMSVGNTNPVNYDIILDVQSSVAAIELSPTSY